MKKYKLNVPERKELVTRLVDLTGQRARYTFMPRCAYEVGGYSVEKDGDVMVSEDVNPEDLQTLLNEGWIVPDGVDATEEARMEPAALQDTMVDEHTPDLDGGCVESEEQSDAESEDTDDAAPENPDDAAPENPDDAALDEDASGEEETHEQETDSSEDEQETEEADSSETESNPTEDGHPCESDAEPVEENGNSADELVISLPMDGHTAQSLRNFLNLMYSRGPLLNKALGTSFAVDGNLLEELDQMEIPTADEMVNRLETYRQQTGCAGMTGLCVTREKVSLVFPGTTDGSRVNAYTQLCAAMNRMTITQKRIQAKEVDDANEKYALRIWLIRLGLNGSEHKELRRLLMKNLSGHAAFRTPEEAEKFRAKEKAKRDALKAARQAQNSQTDSEAGA